MSEAQKVSELRAAEYGVVHLEGRIEEQRVHNRVRYTTLMLPAADAFSRPGIVEIRGGSQLGSTGETVRCKARISGFYGRSFPVKDRETGEVRDVRPVNITLDVVE